MGAVVLLNAGGNVVGTGYISGTGTGGLGVLAPGNIAPVAGQVGLYTTVFDGGPATEAELHLPASVTLDAAGNMYIADSLHNRIRMVCGPSATPTIHGTSCSSGAGIISTIAGNGNPAYSGDGDAAANATLNLPSGVALDGAGNLYIADTGNNVIRVISAASGNIATIAGNGTAGYGGDGLAATSAQTELNQPAGVTLDGNGNIYIADTNNHRIREVTAATGIIATIAGDGFMTSNGSGGYNKDGVPATTAELNFPYAVAFDAQGNMYIPDSANNRIREVMAVGGSITAASIITTVAGTGTTGYTGDGGAANQAHLWSPSGVAVDAAGNVFIADTQNAAIRKVSAATMDISTLIASGTGTSYSNNLYGNVKLYGPIGLYLDGSGDLYFADSLDMVVQEIQGNFVALDYLANPVRQGSQTAPIDQTVENDGNAALDVTALTAGANSDLGSGTTCVIGNLAVAADCTVAAIFAPAVAGDPLTANIDVEEAVSGLAASNPLLDIELVGNATAVNSTTTTVTSGPNPSGYGQNVTFTVTVTTGTGTGNLTGTVNVVDTYNSSTTTLAQSLTLNPSASGTTLTGTGAFSISSLGVGTHSIVATYNSNGSDTSHFTSSSAALIQTVLEGTATTLVSNQNPSATGQSVTFTATVAISGGGGVTPDGTVTFMDGINTLSAQTLTPSGLSASATFTTFTLIDGVHAITAVYSGDSSNQIAGSTSAILYQDVQAPSGITFVSSANPSSFGNLVTFTATISSNAPESPSGIVDFLDNGIQIGKGTLSGTPDQATFAISTLAIGMHSITASYAGDPYNSTVTSAPISQVVNKAQTSSSVSAVPSPGIAGAPLTITATIQVTAGVTTPSGTVTFTSGTANLGAAPLNTTSETAVIKPNLAPGTYSIVATYSGDGDDAGSVSAALPFTMARATTTTTVTAAPTPGIVTAPITFTATVTGNGGAPTGAVNFLANGSAIGSGNLNGSGTATLTTSTLAVGTYAITAQYLGDTDDAGSTSAAFSETVSTVPTVTALGTTTTGGANPQVILVATVMDAASGPPPTGTVTFLNGTTQVGSATLDSTGVATVAPNLTAGIHYSITAAYSGDAEHSPSTSQAVSITGTASNFQVTVAPAAITMAASQNETVTVNLASSGGFTDTIGMGCASLPAGVTCHFSSTSVTLPANGTASTQLTIDTNSPLTGGTTAANRLPSERSIAMAGAILPFSALFGLFLWRMRKRHAGFLTIVLASLLTAGALLVSGCSGISFATAAPGTYVIQVTGTGTGSNVIEFGDITLTITK